MSDSPSADDAWRTCRDYAVRDVLDGMPVIGAAIMWGVQAAADLQRWVADARADGQSES